MATLSEHVVAIQAAIEAARLEGYTIEVDVMYDDYDRTDIAGFDIDLHHQLNYVDTLTHVSWEQR